MVPEIQDDKIGNWQLTALDSLCDIKFSDSGVFQIHQNVRFGFMCWKGYYCELKKNLEGS